MKNEETIRRCVSECATARDERGRWRQERRCAADLLRLGSTPTIATETAKAAAEVGRTIAVFAEGTR